MKYRIADKALADSIWDDPDFSTTEEANSRETILMKASYFDTEDYILSKHDIAFRIRMEGQRIVASLKWKGDSEEGLHKREEINVPVNDEACFINPHPNIFKESEQGKAMIALIGNRPLHSLLETRFLRRKFRMDTGTTLCELAIDTGEIITDFGTLPICEMEVELFSGKEEEMIHLAAEIAAKYDLAPENRSKYARGLTLLEKNNYLK